MQMIRVLSELSEHHIAQLHGLYQREWWSRGRTLEATRRGVSGSQVVIGLVDESDNLVGFTRVITDYTFKALVFDVIVAAGARGRGLGTRLLDLVVAHEALRDVRHIELYCLPELADFYVPLGFSADVGNIRLMRRIREIPDTPGEG
jgi:GNAT superfamily N-acetyltransferase